MTRRDERPARYTFAELTHIDALLARHAERDPALRCDYGTFILWAAERDELAAARVESFSKVRELLCRKCEGTGMTQWHHRSGGVCYSCKGDGWSARGRKARYA